MRPGWWSPATCRTDHWRGPQASVQAQPPVLPDQVMPEAVMRLRIHQLETGTLVDTARGGQDVVGPQDDLPVTRPAREGQALRHQALAQPQAPGGRLDQQQPQLGG